MKRDASTIFVVLYGVGLAVMVVTLLGLLGLIPGVAPFSVEGLTTGQAVGITLVLMALVALRLFLHFRLRDRTRPRPDADPR